MAMETLNPKNTVVVKNLPAALAKGFFLVGILVLLQSCFAPANKEVYLEKFENFIETVEKEHKHYSPEDWEQADKRFEKFSGEWYRKFKGEYTLEDQIRIKGMTFAYKMLRGNENTGNILNDLLKEDLEDYKKRLDDYLENDAEKDLEKLKKEAEKLGDSAIQMLDEVLKDLEEK